MLLLGGAAWAGALAARWMGWWAVVAVLGLVLAHRWRTAGAVALVFAAVAGVAVIRTDRIGGSPVARLAADGAAVRLTGTVTSDPHRTAGRYGDVVITRVDVRSVTGRGTTFALSVPVLVLGDDDWAEVPLGSTVEASGRLSPSDGDDLAGVLGAR